MERTFVYVQGRCPSNAVEFADKLLEEVSDVAKELGMAIVLWRGTCLGFVRDGKYPVSDIDIDIAVRCDEKDREVFFQKLLEIGCTRGVGFNHFIKYDLQLDFCFPNLLEQLDTIKYKGRTYNIPSPVEEFLRQWYGDDWRVPHLEVGGTSILLKRELADDEALYLATCFFGQKGEVLLDYNDDGKHYELDDDKKLVLVLKNARVVKFHRLKLGKL